MTSPQKPEHLRLFLLFLTFCVLLGASLWVMAPFVNALVWATTIVVSTWPILLWVEKRLWGKRSLAAAVMVTFLLLFIFVPLAILAGAVASHASRLADLLPDLMAGNIPPPPPGLGKIPLIGERVLNVWNAVLADGIEPFLVKLRPHSREMFLWIGAQASGAGILLAQLLLTSLLAGILYAQGDVAAGGLRAFARRVGQERGDNALILASKAIRGVALGVVVTAVVQSTLAGLGLLACGVPYAALLTGVAFVSCLVQIGPISVLGPAVAWLFWSGHPTAGGVLFVWFLLVGTLDNVLRPWLIRRGADLPLLLILAGVLGGLFAMGAIGLFIGPVILAVTYTLLEAWVKEGEPAVVDAGGVEGSIDSGSDEESIDESAADSDGPTVVTTTAVHSSGVVETRAPQQSVPDLTVAEPNAAKK